MENVTQYAFMEQERPVLEGILLGGEEFPDLRGTVYVYIVPEGIYLQGDFNGLPLSSEFAFHVHDGLICEELGEKMLLLPDIISDGNGGASMQIYLDRVNSTQIAGKPIVLHLKRNGKETQIACGVLSRIL